MKFQSVCSRNERPERRIAIEKSRWGRPIAKGKTKHRFGIAPNSRRKEVYRFCKWLYIPIFRRSSFPVFLRPFAAPRGRVPSPFLAAPSPRPARVPLR